MTGICQILAAERSLPGVYRGGVLPHRPGLALQPAQPSAAALNERARLSLNNPTKKAPTRGAFFLFWRRW